MITMTNVGYRQDASWPLERMLNSDEVVRDVLRKVPSKEPQNLH
jgi:hypothetical protein